MKTYILFAMIISFCDAAGYAGSGRGVVARTHGVRVSPPVVTTGGTYGGGAYVGEGGYDGGHEHSKPYSYSYDTIDEYGTKTYREESSDGSGAVRGSYSYRDAKGLYRTVYYVADKDGFRVSVRSNEPGLKSSAPADVKYLVEPAPASAYASYGSRNGYSGRGGYGSRGRYGGRGGYGARIRYGGGVVRGRGAVVPRGGGYGGGVRVGGGYGGGAKISKLQQERHTDASD